MGIKIISWKFFGYFRFQPRPQGLLLVQNGGWRKPLAKAAKVAPKVR